MKDLTFRCNNLKHRSIKMSHVQIVDNVWKNQYGKINYPRSYFIPQKAKNDYCIH